MQKFWLKQGRQIGLVIALGLGGLLLLDLLSALLAESFWFATIGYFRLFGKRLLTQGFIGIAVFASSLGLLGLQLDIAQRQVWPSPEFEIERPQRSGSMRLWRLLPLVLLLSAILAASLIYYGQIAATHWHPNLSLRSTTLPVPLKFDQRALWNLLQAGLSQPWQLLLVAGMTLLLLIYPRLTLRVVALLVSLMFMLVLSERWDLLLLALNSIPFNATEPLFETDVGFYIFTLPLLELLEFWLLGLAALCFLAVSLTYLLSADSLSQGYFPGFSARQLRHLCWLAGWLVLMMGCGYWLDRYKLLYDASGATYGAAYTGVAVQLPVYRLLSLAALPIAGWLFNHAIRLREARTALPRLPRLSDLPDSSRPVSPPISRPASPSVLAELEQRIPSYRRYREAILRPNLPPKAAAPSLKPSLLTPLRWGLGAYLLVSLLLAGLLPLIVQQLIVLPNELQLEQPFIQRTIALTRQGFNLDKVEVETFNPSDNLTRASLQANDLTIENIRLWDKRPLLETNRQLQRIRLYYEFPDADIDRYSLPNEAGQTIQQQVLIAARELDYSAVPAAAQTWVNQHLVYTHGYGFTVSPVNRVAEGGLPDYLIRGIETTEDPRIRGALPTGKPRIYFGELTDTYVMTQTRLEELDYPSGSDNVYNRYDGWDGVSIGNLAQRLLYAKHLKDWQMLFTDDFTPQSKLLFRRNINERIKTIAPFLRYDSDPYLVVADTGNKQWQHQSPQAGQAGQASQADDSYLYWMIDAYTTSDRYPYSDPLDNDFNYIRNSVKVLVDAYHGSVTFYIADPQDPVIQAWSRIFPNIFRPLSDMPLALRQHVRYPQDYLRVQANQLMTYHMTDPIVFYNREDQWRAPNEIYNSEQQVVDPYYLIMKLPIASSEEFVLLQPFTPAQRNNLIAWTAARSDGNQYGKILLYIFPKQELVFGPEQIEARINQDPVISERISLWNRRGSRAAQGNLIVIPIEQSLLYIEPLYLIAEQNQIPTLVRVIAVYGSRIVMAETLEGALNAIFLEADDTEAPILRTTEPPEPEL
ncbi:MAG: UPF0182 family protein [Pegethrix bostrychoides GSE-TBD4-15B]|jgi:uncharacterized membrane protein (UPF0182 family)|uniref:UPF0182 protein KME07_14475 n=1 Tax=Pegethrix bostrychoides GSE-TBD4-15B TaxID=2839662 RepID=A0A951PBF0_9CYAN|nr:UPF0182 family protein [Pegethrix bostrychoides GSE-TBD4-15B]